MLTQAMYEKKKITIKSKHIIIFKPELEEINGNETNQEHFWSKMKTNISNTI